MKIYCDSTIAKITILIYIYCKSLKLLFFFSHPPLSPLHVTIIRCRFRGCGRCAGHRGPMHGYRGAGFYGVEHALRSVVGTVTEVIVDPEYWRGFRLGSQLVVSLYYHFHCVQNKNHSQFHPLPCKFLLR